MLAEKYNPISHFFAKAGKRLMPASIKSDKQRLKQKSACQQTSCNQTQRS